MKKNRINTRQQG